MCTARDWLQSSLPKQCNGQHKQQPPRRYKIRVHRLIVVRRRNEGMKRDEGMELKNLKLYLENRSILEENEKLRRKAILLRQENEALLREYQTKIKVISHQNLT